uniref:Uncharacterized protein n=1 Tax=Peromyscus maniculatus bairdii TaxID=230844 RepID=A0A8C8UJT2_PERMB
IAPANGFLLQNVCLLPVTHLASFSIVFVLPCHFLLFSPWQVLPGPSSISTPPSPPRSLLFGKTWQWLN